MNSKLIARYAVRESLGLVMMGVALFWSAGRMDWWPGWAALAVVLAWTAATAIVILRSCPELLAERLGPRKGGKTWDVAIMGIMGILQLVGCIVAGLDERYGWTGGMALAVQILALLLCGLGYALFVWATASNRFFSQVVRIQAERGHAVATGGPYCYVRHPAYAGSVVFELAVPFLLASWWALIPSIICAALLFLRTALEDRTLQRELSGYADYARRVPFRLIPAVW